MVELAEIKKIVLKIGDKELEITLDEAKELKDLLVKTFGSDNINYIPFTYPQPYYPVYPRPYYPYPDYGPTAVPWNPNTSPYIITSSSGTTFDPNVTFKVVG